MTVGLVVYLFFTFTMAAFAAPPNASPSSPSNCPYLRGKKDLGATSLLHAVAELQGALSQRCQKVAATGSALQASLGAQKGLIQQQLLASGR